MTTTRARGDMRVFTIASLCVILFAITCLFGVPSTAHADVQAAGSSVQQPEQPLLENSWRYENGKPRGYNATELTTQAQTPASAAKLSMTREGIDVSEHNGSINWTKVAKKMEFAIIRCGYGSDAASQDDQRWLENVVGCRAAGLPMGVYIYSYATSTAQGKSEAKHVIRCLQQAGLTPATLELPIYLDMEDERTADLSRVMQKAIFDQFRKTLNASGYTHVGIYSSRSWWMDQLSTVKLEGEYRWVANWYVDSPFNGGDDTMVSKGCGLWQYGSDGSVSGISGRVDMNYASDDWSFLSGTSTAAETEVMLPMYRLYNKYSGEHLYTSDASERDNLKKLGWKYEGVGWKAPDVSGMPVYRLYNKYAPGGDHHYTTSEKEYKSLVKKGWSGEGIAWYSSWVDKKPVYRLYNPNAYKEGYSGAHHYTLSTKERDKLVKLGWKDEGVAWYGESA